MAKKVIEGAFPAHIAIIMDGNGRWAKKRLLPRTAGHAAGGDRFVKTVEACDDLGVKFFTVYALSTENWSRSEEEISGLIKLIHTYIKKYTPDLIKRNIKLRLFGDLSRFDAKTRQSLEESVRTLDANTGMTLGIALSYGGRAEIVAAAQKLLDSKAETVTEAEFSGLLYTNEVPDPDLIIRTGGEKRISNFLLWQSAYAEYVFTDVLWPDFDENELKKAIDEFGSRKRRFGKEK